MKKSLFLFLLLPLHILLFAQSAQDSSATDRSRKFIVKEPLDKDRYIHLKEYFYTDKDGRLYMRLLAMCGRDCEPGTFKAVYVQTMPLTGKEPYDTLKNFIDVPTYQDVSGSQYSKDKNHVYIFFANSCGGNLRIVTGADPSTLNTIIDYRWARDKNKLFYEGSEVKGCDPDKIRVIYPDHWTSNQDPEFATFWIGYITDGKNIWYGSEKLEDADLKTFHLVMNGKNYDAEDKNHKYQMGYNLDRANEGEGL